MLLCLTWPPRWAAALERLKALQHAGASVATRWADTDIVDGRDAAATGEAKFADAAVVHRFPLGHGQTRAFVHAWRAGAWVRELAPASYESHRAPEETQVERLSRLQPSTGEELEGATQTVICIYTQLWPSFTDILLFIFSLIYKAEKAKVSAIIVPLLVPT